MAGAPKYKVYTEDVYRAAFKDAYDALMFLTCIGQGDIRCGHAKKDILFAKSECQDLLTLYNNYEEMAKELEEAERKLWQREA